MRDWTVEFDCPILSVHYSLSPEFPYPQACEEVFDVYRWALKNQDVVGSTCENVVFVGDSAGANLLAACLIKCIELGVEKPKGFLSIYGAYLLSPSTSPSRLMSVSDLLINFKGFMYSVKAYKGLLDNGKETTTKDEKVPETRIEIVENSTTKDYLISPYKTPQDVLAQFPVTKVVSTNSDMLLDDSVEFAKRLRSAGVNVHVEVLEGLNHGFLNTAPVINRLTSESSE